MQWRTWLEVQMLNCMPLLNLRQANFSSNKFTFNSQRGIQVDVLPLPLSEKCH